MCDKGSDYGHRVTNLELASGLIARYGTATVHPDRVLILHEAELEARFVMLFKHHAMLIKKKSPGERTIACNQEESRSRKRSKKND